MPLARVRMRAHRGQKKQTEVVRFGVCTALVSRMPSCCLCGVQAIGRSMVLIRRCAVRSERLASRSDRLDDIRGQKSKWRQAAGVTIADPFDHCEFSDTAGLTRDERLETAIGSPDLLQQDRIRLCRTGGRPFDDHL